MLPVLPYEALKEQIRAGRYILAMRDERSWTIYRVEHDWNRRMGNAVVVDTDEEYFYGDQSDNLHEESSESTGYATIVYGYYVRAVFDDVDTAKAVNAALQEAYNKFEKDTAEARITFQIGALSAINSSVPALLRHRA